MNVQFLSKILFRLNLYFFTFYSWALLKSLQKHVIATNTLNLVYSTLLFEYDTVKIKVLFITNIPLL